MPEFLQIIQLWNQWSMLLHFFILNKFTCSQLSCLMKDFQWNCLFCFLYLFFFFIIYSICAKKILFSNINWLKMNYQYHFLHRERKKTENTTLKTITTMHYEHFSFENKLMPDIWLYEDARLPLSYNKEDRRKWCTFELPTYVFCCFYLTWNIRSCNMNDIA